MNRANLLILFTCLSIVTISCLSQGEYITTTTVVNNSDYDITIENVSYVDVNNSPFFYYNDTIKMKIAAGEKKLVQLQCQ